MYYHSINAINDSCFDVEAEPNKQLQIKKIKSLKRSVKT